MSILTLKFENLNPLPRNRSHSLIVKGGRPMNIKTPLARDFEKAVEDTMKEFSSQCSKFKDSYIPDKHYISAEYYLFTPRNILITKEGKISSRANDSDSNKVFRDCIYRFIGLDDKLERDSRFFTPISHDDNHNVIVILKLERIECLTNTASLTQNLIEQTKDDLTLFV